MLFSFVIAVPVHEVPQRAEGWTLPWRRGHGPAGEPERLARCRGTCQRRWQRFALLLHHRALHRCQVQRAHSKDWQQLQGLYVSDHSSRPQTAGTDRPIDRST